MTDSVIFAHHGCAVEFTQAMGDTYLHLCKADTFTESYLINNRYDILEK